MFTFHPDHILSKTASFETILSLLSSFFIPESDDLLLSWIFNVMRDDKVRREMDSSRDVWHDLVERGEEGQALL
jgi:USP6 N-terminal-like protein